MTDPKPRRPMGLERHTMVLKADPDDIHHLKLALSGMLEGYEVLLRTLPRGTIAHSAVLGAQGHKAQAAYNLLDHLEQKRKSR